MTNHRRFDIGSSTSESFEGDEALATAVKSLVWDGDDDFLRARIQTSRASGVRVLLPTVDRARVPLPETNGRRWMRRVLRAAIGIAACLLAAVFVQRAPEPLARTAAASRASDTRATPRESLADVLAPWPRLAFAQGELDMQRTYAPVVVARPERVLEGDRSFVQTVAQSDGTEMIPIAYNSVSVRRDTVENALCIVTQSSMTEDNARRLGVDVGSSQDTLFVDAFSLQPKVHRFTTGDSRKAFQSTGTTRFHQGRFGSEFRYIRPVLPYMQRQYRDGGISTPRETGPIDSTRLYVPDEQSLLLLLQALPLHDGWRGSIQVPSGLGAIYDQTFALNLRVDGVDTVSVYRDRYLTWRGLLETGPTPEVWHVRQTTGEVLLVEQRGRDGALRAKRYLIGGLAWPDSGRVGGPAR